MRFLVSLPVRPVLIEARVTIDGVPYLQSREARIRRVLDDAAKISPKTNHPAGESVEAAPEETVAVQTQPERAQDEGADGAEEETEEEAAPVNPPIVAEYSLASTVADQIARFASATDHMPSDNEVRWLLTNRVDGPVLLFLSDNFQRFRAAERPAFAVLDQNADQQLDADELAAAVGAFQRCDLNRDQIIDYTEIERSAEDPRRSSTTAHSQGGRLLVPVPTAETAGSAYRRIAARYATDATTPPLVPRFDVNGDGRFDADEIRTIQTSTADVRLRVSFDTRKPTNSRVEFVAANQELLSQSTAEATGIRMTMDGSPLVISAVQGSASDQISIGAVEDGYPVLPEVDPNEDGRFTIRELRSLVERLHTFDTNGDGRVTTDETKTTTRICFALGPVVHRELAGLRRLKPQTATVTAGPEWFARMDRNADNDLTRAEFPGTDDQFTALDADADELISAEEANNFDKNQAGSANETPESESKDLATPEVNDTESLQ